MMWTDMEDHII